MQRRAFLAAATAFGATFGAGTARADVLIINAPRDGFLSLRTGPGSGFDIIIEMPNGTEVHTLEWSGSWVRVRHVSGHTGWCSSDYLARPGR